MMKPIIKKTGALLLAVLLISMLTLPASANSAQMRWEGQSASGALVLGEDCPLEVEHEDLTFEVQELPQKQDLGPDPVPGGTVTAGYAFYNPADYQVKTTLVFPFGQRAGQQTERYEITVDGEVISYRIRHTYSEEGQPFELERDRKKLRDGFADHPFFSREMTVKRYIFQPEDIDWEAVRGAAACIRLKTDPDRTAVWLESLSEAEHLEDGSRLWIRLEKEKPVVLNIIGRQPETMPQWQIFGENDPEKEIPGRLQLAETKTMTLEELALQEYDENAGIRETDWYNAVLDMLDCFDQGQGVYGARDSLLDQHLMQWYEYDLELEPGQRLVNTVTAPLYPEVRADYEPAVYIYTYLLSPARSWASFGTLHISIHTPFQLVSSAPMSFAIEDSGYKADLPGLPQEEMSFLLSTSANPSPKAQAGPMMFIGALVGVVVLFLAITGGSVLLLNFIKKKMDKK